MVAIGKPAKVFDAFAGEGQMYSSVWNGADRYVGCDLKYRPDGRLMFAADNRRVLRAIDLAEFNIFDLDAYGSSVMLAAMSTKPINANAVRISLLQ